MGSLKIFLIPLYFCKMLAGKYISSNKIMLWKSPFSSELLRRGMKNIYFYDILFTVCIWKQAQLLRTCSRKVLNFSYFLEVHNVIYTTQVHVIIHIGLQWVYIGMICVVTFWSYDESYNDDGYRQKRSQ